MSIANKIRIRWDLNTELAGNHMVESTRLCNGLLFKEW